MRKILVSSAAVMALAAAVIFVPRASAETGVAQLSPNGTISIPITRKVTNVYGKTSMRANYKITEKEGNPAPIGGLQVGTSIGITKYTDSNNSVSGDCKLALQYLRFSKVGNYALTIEETGVSDPVNFMQDTENKYDVFFTVSNVLDSNQMPTGELRVELMNQLYSYKDDAKVPLSANFEAPAIRTYVSLTNQVKGAGADSDKYFKYAVTMSGVGEQAEIEINGQDNQIEYDGSTIPANNKYTSTGGEDTFYVYLKHGQTATIGLRNTKDGETMQLPAGFSYKIEKVDTDDGYAVTMDGESVLESTKTAHATSADDFVASNTTTIINSKDSTVNTGVFTEAWPYLIVAVFGLSGFVITRRIMRSA